MPGEFNPDVGEFLWWTIDSNAMKFFIREEDGTKKYPTSTCLWWNEHDLHGSDGVPEATFCLRVDGVFTDDFRNKIKCML